VQWLSIAFAIIGIYVAVLSLLACLARRRAWDFQKMGSVPQALATVLGVAALIVGWGVSDRQAVERDVLTKEREQASILAEYAALVWLSKDSDDIQIYRRINQLSWQLFLWLPTDVYRQLGRGLVKRDPKELADTFLAIRGILLGSGAGTLDANDIIVHAPGIGNPKTKP